MFLLLFLFVNQWFRRVIVRKFTVSTRFRVLLLLMVVQKLVFSPSNRVRVQTPLLLFLAGRRTMPISVWRTRVTRKPRRRTSVTVRLIRVLLMILVRLRVRRWKSVKFRRPLLCLCGLPSNRLVFRRIILHKPKPFFVILW